MSNTIEQHEIPQYENNIKENLRTLKDAVEQQDWDEVITHAEGIVEDAKEIQEALEEAEVIAKKDAVQKVKIAGLVDALASVKKSLKPAPKKRSKETLERQLKHFKKSIGNELEYLREATAQENWEEMETWAESILSDVKDGLETAEELKDLTETMQKLIELPGVELSLWFDPERERYTLLCPTDEDEIDEMKFRWLTGDVTTFNKMGEVYFRFWEAREEHPADMPPSSCTELTREKALVVLAVTGWVVRLRSRDPKEITFEEYAAIGAVNEGPFRAAARAKYEAQLAAKKEN